MLFALDHALFALLNQLPHTGLLDGIALLIHRATYGGLIYYPFLVYVLMQKDPRQRLLGKLGAISGILTYFVTDLLLKHAVERLRPCGTLVDALCATPAPLSFSFPSGQAATAFAVATLVALVYPERRKTRWALFGGAALVAVSRVYMGHHYPSDVLVGAALGALVSYGVFRLLKRSQAC